MFMIVLIATFIMNCKENRIELQIWANKSLSHPPKSGLRNVCAVHFSVGKQLRKFCIKN